MVEESKFRKLVKSCFLLVLMLILLLQVGFSALPELSDGISEFKYLYFQIDEGAQTNKVAYAVEFKDIENYVFKMKIEYNGEVQEKVCEKELLSSSDMDFRKIICEVPKYGGGGYRFVAFLLDDLGRGNVLINNEYLEVENDGLGESLGLSSSVSFEDLGEKTVVFLKISGKDEKLRVKHTIPKEVIKSLTEKNRNELIETDFDYEIIKEDPLIAWNIERAPVNINYTINKRVPVRDMENFNIEITSQPYFNYLKGIIFVLIFGILVYLMLPLFRRDLDKNESKK